MALSGTLETFSIPEVLRLLASTGKTGSLTVEGDRGIGRVWIEDGRLVGADADGAPASAPPAAVVFALLRFEAGDFAFSRDERAPAPVTAQDVDDVLDDAEARLAEWREIEAVVPSLDVRVTLVPSISASVEITPDRWSLVAAIGGGAGGRAVAAHLDEDELGACRALRDLVDAGLVTVEAIDPEPVDACADPDSSGAGSTGEPGPPTAAMTDWSGSGSVDLAAHVRAAVAVGTEPGAEGTDDGASDVVRTDGDDVDGPVAPDDPEATVTVPGPRHLAVVEGAEDLFDDDGDDDADLDTHGSGASAVGETAEDAPAVDESTAPSFGGGDLAAQLANLSPKAAAAIEAIDGAPASSVTAAFDRAVAGDGADEGDRHEQRGFVDSLLPRDVDDDGAVVDQAEDDCADGGSGLDADAPGSSGSENLLLRFLSSNR